MFNLKINYLRIFLSQKLYYLTSYLINNNIRIIIIILYPILDILHPNTSKMTQASSTYKLNTKLKQLDVQPYTIQLNYKNKHDFTSTTGGLISLLFYLGALTVIVINAVNFFNQTQFIFDQYLIKNDFDRIDLGNQSFGLLITGSNDTHTFNITNQTQSDYGIQVVTEQADEPNAQNPHQELAVGCNFTQFNFTDFYCFSNKINLTIAGRSDVFSNATYHRLGLIIKNTSMTQNQTAKYLKNLTVIFFLINNVTNPKQKKFIVGTKIRKFYLRDGLALKQQQIQQLILYFQRLYVRTDTNLFYQDVNIKQSSFYDEEFLSSTITNNDKKDDRLVWIKMKRSLFSVQYQRHYKKIQTFLAQTFGLIGLISLVFIIYRGYNKWCFTQTELMRPSERKKTNIFKYYYHALKNLKHITKSSQVYDQFEHNLDIYKILSKLDDYEQRLRKLEGRSEIKYEEGYQPQHAVKKDQNNNKLPSQQADRTIKPKNIEKKKNINYSESQESLLSPKKK